MNGVVIENWALDWFSWWSTVSVRGTIVMLAVLTVVYTTQRWTGPAWRFLACLFAIGGLAIAAATSVCGWRWEVLPSEWQLTQTLPELSVMPLQWVFLTWALGVVWFFGRLLLGHLNLWLLSATTPAVDSVALLTRIERLRQKIGLRRKIHIVASSRRSVPMTWGVFRVNLLLPTDVLNWPDDRLDAVILHEMAHIRRWDCFWQWCSQTISCLFWFNPVVWLANRKMWHEREIACDALAIGIRGSVTCRFTADASIKSTIGRGDGRRQRFVPPFGVDLGTATRPRQGFSILVGGLDSGHLPGHRRSTTVSNQFAENGDRGPTADEPCRRGTTVSATRQGIDYICIGACPFRPSPAHHCLG